MVSDLRQTTFKYTLMYVKISFYGFLFIHFYLVFSSLFFKVLPFCLSVIDDPEVVYGIFLLVITILTFKILGAKDWIVKVVRSNRLDIYSVFLLGASVNFFLNDFAYNFYFCIVNKISVPLTVFVILLPLLLLLVNELRLLSYKQHNKNNPLFLSDNPSDLQSDGLKVKEQANVFAKNVLNNGSDNSMVFGIDAPWGMGKTTFVNFCVDYWLDLENQPVVYRFEPTLYKDHDELMNKFVDGLIVKLKKTIFIPEIKELIKKYAKSITVSKVSLLNEYLSIELIPDSYTSEDVYRELNILLSNIDKKIIIIIDDLDRSSFSAIKDVLHVIKESFGLPNVSYVLCYSSSNIGVLDRNDVDKVKLSEFLEKYVNVKTNLLIGATDLDKFVQEEIGKVVSVDEQGRNKYIQSALKGLREVLLSNNLYHYHFILGDLRKIKRLINTFILLKIDPKGIDINIPDLIHLLLIYIYFPNIFRDIFSLETGGNRGFFTALTGLDQELSVDVSNNNRVSGSHFTNSKKFQRYIKCLGDKRAKFLLEQVFDVKTKLKTTLISAVSPDEKDTFACFNGGWVTRKNLERYLDLIVKGKIPPRGSQVTTYKTKIEYIFSDPNNIEKNLNKVKFDEDLNQEDFWSQMVVMSPDNVDKLLMDQVIKYLIKNVNKYPSVGKNSNNGSIRTSLLFFLAQLLDKYGWIDENQKRENNSDDNIIGIANWIFGEGEYNDIGVISTLLDGDKPVLGFYDVLSFRLFCCADRGASLFNLQRALSKHGNRDVITDGVLSTLVVDEMREFSQIVFNEFKKMFIDKKENIFENIDNLDLEGGYHEVEVFKTRLISFILYQLTNDRISAGIGCGYYDINGVKDNGQIRKEMNKYLFNTCFTGDAGVKYFIKYLLILSNPYFDHEHDELREEGVFEVFEKDMLTEYFKENEEDIKGYSDDIGVFYSEKKRTYKENKDKLGEFLNRLH